MSFTEKLERELTVRRVRPAVRQRIMLEYADHIASGTESAAERLGDPADLAGLFAAELASHDARRTTRNIFLALSATAVALVAGQLAIGQAGGYPGVGNGRSAALWIPAILAILCGPQVALVSGLLATARALRGRRAAVIADAEVALIYRRGLLAAGAGLATCLGILLYTVNFSQELASWWVWTQAGLAASAALGLVLAIRSSLRGRLTVGGVAGEPVSLLAAVGPVLDAVAPLRILQARPWRVAGLLAALVVLATIAFTGHAERSFVEGLERGCFEAVFLACAFGITRYCAGRWRSR